MTVTSACTRCGEPITPGVRVCKRCGADVSGEQSSLPTAMVRPTPPAVLDAQQALQLDALRQATLGDYEIMGELGRGGMATVYLAHEIALDRKVAIKVMSPALLSGEGMVERFKREARTAAALSHPHVIPIYAVKESPQVVFFVMKFVEGRPLDSIIREVGPLPIAMVRAILYQVGSALGYAHGRGVVHRDMKPANIMVDTDGWAIVTDFGIAKVSQAQGLTMTGATIGTPYYMSPEQCAAKKELTGASDQYSLGIVAYEMLTGKVPFMAESTLGIMYAHFHEQPKPVTEARPDCPPETAAALLKMLAKEPEQRFADVESAVAAIGAAPLTRDDPTLAKLKSLARAGAGAALAKTVSTPASPPPAAGPTRTAGKPQPSARVPATRVAKRGGIPRWVWPVAAVLATVAVWAAFFRPPARQGTSIPVSLPNAGPTQPPGVGPTPRPTVPIPPTALRRESTTTRGTPPPATRSFESQQQESQFRAVQVEALSRRLRASGAGASAAELAPGDAEAQQADILARQHRFADAQAHLQSAIASWNTATEMARERAPTRASRPVRAPEARAEIDSAIAEFGAALESRDLSRLRRAYSGMTVAQAQEWGAFFLKARSLTVRLAVTAMDRAGLRVNATVDGTYDYDDINTGQGMHQAVSLQATLERGLSGWRLTSIH